MLPQIKLIRLAIQIAFEFCEAIRDDENFKAFDTRTLTPLLREGQQLVDEIENLKPGKKTTK